MSKVYRDYQEEADIAIYEELLINNKCIVKMFCGTGKSLLMRKSRIVENQSLVVYVFPSLGLIDQFYTDYLFDFPRNNILKISSEKESTTEPVEIRTFLSKSSYKIICITYQSFKTLLDCLDGIRIDVCLFDEAHHAVGETCQTLIFENDASEKQIFFTATPKNNNGIVMYDRNNLDASMCGNLVYDYSYLRGVNEGYLNPFEIRIDMYTENTNKSVFESIARAILASGNNRVLTFHSDVNTDRETSVLNFVDDAEFKRIFKEIQKAEFPQIKKYKKISMVGLSGSNKDRKDRPKLLKKFDATPDNEVIIISSCETIGEGIDTKNANMCVFVDPKSSYVKIIQNIGRIVRKQFGVDKPNSTILIPCWVDKTKYLDCGGDREKCDEVIRQDMSADGGNFNGILNVLSALKQEDEDLYDICLYYPDTFSPQEIRSNLEKQGFRIDEPVGDGGLVETMEHLLDVEIDYEEYEDCDTDEEMIMRIAEDNEVCVEIHTTSLENPVETYNSECESGEVIRLYKTPTEEDDEDVMYQPIVAKCGAKRNGGSVRGPNRANRLNVNVHTNPDVKVLWNITAGFDITKDICSCVIDCEVVDKWYDNFEELKKFIDENKRKPSQRSKNETEKKLGNWISTQQTNYKKKLQAMKDTTKYDLWTTFLEEYQEYFKSDDEVWNEKLSEAKKFIDDNLRTPVMNAKNEFEKVLGKWLSHQKDNYINVKHCMRDKTKYDLWTTFLEEYQEYLKTNDERWNETFEQVKMFIGENKKRPSEEANNKTENKLGKWVGNQYKNYKQLKEGMKEQTRYDLWTKFLEEYQEYFKSDDEVWNETFEQVQKFINENKKRPSSMPNNTTEKKLCNWICTQQNNYKRKIQSMNDSTKYDLWTKFLEEYQEYLKTNDDRWNETFEQVKMFIGENKKRPSEDANNKTEKKLGRWVSTQCKNYKQLQEGMKEQTRYDLWTKFLEEYQEYFKSDDEVWNETFEQVKKFIDDNLRKPVISAKNENEKKLGSWIYTQQNNYKQKIQAMKDTVKYDLWTKFLEEYNEYIDLSLEYKPKEKSDDEVWYETFEQVKKFIDENKRKPSPTSKNEVVKKLGNWISTQQTNYKKKLQAMKDAAKYDLWTTFLEEYQEYFKSDDEIWNENLNKLKIFLNKNKRRPSHKTGSEKTLWKWLSHQVTNYKNKKHGMKDQIRYNQWTVFLQEYQEYFSKDTTSNTDTQSISTSESSAKQKSAPKKKSMKLSIKSVPVESPDQRRQRTKTEISVLHQRYKTLKSENLHQEFNSDPDLWHKYHEISEENEKSFPEDEIPRNRIIQDLDKIKTKRPRLVVDMGCGKAQIAQYFATDPRFKFINYDHISSNDTVISCDIANTPLEDETVEICILSLAMWGSNCREYIQEANRILESNGQLYIIEPTKRWSEKDNHGTIIPGKEGGKLISSLEENGFCIVRQSIEKFCLFVCNKV